MNEIFRRRLIGLAVLLVLAFILSLLLPGTGSRTGPGEVPTTTVALGVLPTPAESPRPAAEPAPALQLAPALKPATPAEPKADVALPKADVAQPKPAPSALASTKKTVPPPPAAGATVKPPVKPPVPAAASAAVDKPVPAPVPVPTITPKPHLVETPTLSKPATPPVPAPATVAAKPAAPAPAAIAESKPAAATLWYVQIGSFADTGNAQTTLSLLQNIGYRGESSRITNSAGKALFRVRLGPFPTEPVARQALDKVSRQGYPQARLTSEARP